MQKNKTWPQHLREFIAKFEHHVGGMYEMLHGTSDDPDNDPDIKRMLDWFALVYEEAPALEREAVDESDLARALEVFDPVWTALAPREQARRLRLLIERIGYDGRDGTVTVAFRSLGIKALCTEAAVTGAEDTA